MGTSKSQTWIVGTVLIGLLIFAGAWFLLITPKRAQTDDARAANEDALFQQDQLRNRLAVLEEQSTHVDEYQDEIDLIGVQIPPEVQISAYVRSLQGLADQYGVTITALSPSYPIAFSEAAGVEAVVRPTSEATDDASGSDAVDSAENAAQTAEDASADSSGDATVEPTPTDTGATPTDGLFAIPLGVQVVGTYANVTAFLEGMQTQVGRLFLVTTVEALSQDAQDAQGGRPATSPGDVELTINGLLYEYLDSTPAIPDGESETAEPAGPTPLPTTDRNPFAPVAGS